MEFGQTSSVSNHVHPKLKLILLAVGVVLVAVLSYLVWSQKNSSVEETSYTSPRAKDEATITPGETTEASPNVTEQVEKTIVVSDSKSSLYLYNTEGKLLTTVDLSAYYEGALLSGLVVTGNTTHFNHSANGKSNVYTVSSSGKVTKTFLSSTNWIKVAFSDDGTQVAWTDNIYSEPNGQGVNVSTSTLFVANVDGTNKKEVLKKTTTASQGTGASIYTPVKWSSDNKKVYLSQTGDGLGGGPGTHYGINGATTELVSVDLSTRKETVLETGRAFTITGEGYYTLENPAELVVKGVGSPFSIKNSGYSLIYGGVFSDDRTKVAYVAFASDSNGDVVKFRPGVASREQNKLFSDLVDLGPVGWIDNNTILLASYGESRVLATVKADGTGYKEINKDNPLKFAFGTWLIKK